MRPEKIYDCGLATSERDDIWAHVADIFDSTCSLDKELDL